MRSETRCRRWWIYILFSILLMAGMQEPIKVCALSGTITYYDGDRYVGNYKENEIKNGKGTYYCSDGTKITGTWKEDYLTGKGKIVYSNKDIFDGDFKEDKRNGSGKYTWKNGDYYSGKWKNDLMHGKGKYVWKNKVYITGTWNNGKLNGTSYLKKGNYQYTLTVKNGVLKKVVKKKKV